ncbi:MAG: DUF559 domain-containing protein [bacterium]|nr:DUF559 domain-containing protein [bacterium]
MHRVIPKTLLRNSRALRQNQTPWEQKLWQRLRAHRFFGFQFKRQVQIGKYVVDFCCWKMKLIIELDGGQHNESSAEYYDHARDKFLRSEGYRVLRIWNNELDQNLEGALEKIRETVLPLYQTHPSKGERG